MIYFDIFCDVLSNMKEIINFHLNVPKCPESLSNQSICDTGYVDTERAHGGSLTI